MLNVHLKKSKALNKLCKLCQCTIVQTIPTCLVTHVDLGTAGLFAISRRANRGRFI